MSAQWSDRTCSYQIKAKFIGLKQSIAYIFRNEKKNMVKAIKLTQFCHNWECACEFYIILKSEAHAIDVYVFFYTCTLFIISFIS